MDVYDRFLAYWHRDDLLPVPEYAVVQAFADLRFPLSNDACRLYQMIGGIDDYVADGNMFCVWSLSRMRQDNHEYRSSGLLWFADFLICSHLYGLRYEGRDASAVYLGYCTGTPRRIAENVPAFLELYLTNPQATEAYLP